VTTQDLSTTFIGLIVLWAIWSVFSRKVRDGVIGKVIYASIALSGYAIVTRAETAYITPTVAGVTFHASLALAGMRHIFMVTWWPQVKRWLCRKMNCEHCIQLPTDKQN
jgi:hypothetical protein